MKEEIKNKWVEALRSGRYQQGKSMLRRDDSYCCLGVLSDISKIGKWEFDRGLWIYNDEVVAWNAMPTHKVFFEYAGMKDVDSALWNGKYRDSLSALNDSGKTFNEIADVIEENWKEL